MIGSKVPPNVWLKNFKAAIQGMIDEELASGHSVTGIIVTEGIAIKLKEAYGYECTDFLGYVLDVLERESDEAELEEMVMLKGNTLQ